MSEITLNEYIEIHGQTATAKKLGITQGAIWQMVKNGRDITVVDVGDGEIKAYEKKYIGTAAA